MLHNFSPCFRWGMPRSFLVRSSGESYRTHSLVRTYKNASPGDRGGGKVWNRKAQRELCTHQAGRDIKSIEGAIEIKTVERVTSHDGRERDLMSGLPINLQLRSCRVQDASEAVEARHKDLCANGGNSSLGQSADAHHCHLTSYTTQIVGMKQVAKTGLARDENEAARQ